MCWDLIHELSDEFVNSIITYGTQITDLCSCRRCRHRKSSDGCYFIIRVLICGNTDCDFKTPLIDTSQVTCADKN